MKAVRKVATDRMMMQSETERGGRLEGTDTDVIHWDQTTSCFLFCFSSYQQVLFYVHWQTNVTDGWAQVASIDMMEGHNWSCCKGRKILLQVRFSGIEDGGGGGLLSSLSNLNWPNTPTVLRQTTKWIMSFLSETDHRSVLLYGSNDENIRGGWSLVTVVFSKLNSDAIFRGSDVSISLIALFPFGWWSIEGPSLYY